MDDAYEETDRISPHFGHWIQPLDEGKWWCLTCEQREEEDADNVY